MAQDENYIGIAMGMDVSDLKAGISEANKRIKEANAEFKAASSGMDDWKKSTDGLNAKIKQLDTVLQSQKSKLNGLQAEYDRVVEAQGENSEAARNLKIQLNNQQAAVNTTERELNNYQQTLSDAESGAIDLNQVVLRGGSVFRNYADETANAADETENAGNSAESASGGFTVMKGALANLVSEGIKAASAALKDFIVDTDSATSNFAAKTGISGNALAQFNNQINDIYKNNYGESLNDVADAMALVAQSTKETDPSKIKELTQNAIVLRDTFDFDVRESMRAVNMLMEQFGVTGEEAYNLIVQGAQNGLNKNDDLLDTINEYGVHYKQLGYTADDFFNSLVNGAGKGTFSVDKLGDAMKEFGIRAKDTATTTQEGFTLLGYSTGSQNEQIIKLTDGISKLEGNLKKAKEEQSKFNSKTSEATRLNTAAKIEEYSAALEEARSNLEDITTATDAGKGSIDDLQARFAAGGETAKAATAEVVSALFSMEDEVKRNQAGVDLFGTMWEDLGADAIKALTETNGEISQTEDAMKKLDDVKYSDVGSQLKALGRQFITEVFTPLAKKAIPKVKEFIDNFKKSGAIDKFKDTLKKVGDIVKKLAQTFLPPLTKALGFLIDNFDTLTPIVLTAVAAFSAFNSVMKITGIITAAKTALTALTAGVGLATKAQVIWNAAMSANPIGAVVTAVAALAAGIGLLVVAIGKSKTPEEEELERLKEKKTAYEDAAKAQRDSIKAAEEEAQKGVAQLDHIKRLKEELGLLVEENGKVKEGYEGRVDFILNELNSALGTEYKLNEGIIGEYQQMQQEIDLLIAKKRAQIIMDARGDAYKSALENQSKYLSDAITAEREYYDARNKLADYDSKHDEERRKKLRELQNMDAEQMRMTELEKQAMIANTMSAWDTSWEHQRKALEDGAEVAKESFETTSRTAKENTELIVGYDADMARLASGKADEIERVNNRISESYTENGETVKLSLQKQLENERLHLKNLLQAHKDGNADVTEETLKASQYRIKALEQEISDATSAVESGQEKYNHAWTEMQAQGLVGFNSQTGEFTSTGKNAVANAVFGANSEQGSYYTKMNAISKAGADAFGSAANKTEYENAGKTVLSGIGKGLDDAGSKGSLFSKIKNLGMNLISNFKLSIDAHSPSKAFIKAAKTIPQGIAEGIKNNAGLALDAVSGLGADMISAYDIGGLSSGISSKVGSIKAGAASDSFSRNTVINAGLTINYNGRLSRKQIYQEQNDHYTAVKTRLRTEGAI